MDPIVVSPTIQEFNGIRFYRCGNYYQHGYTEPVRLHRAVWEQYHGAIPDDCDVHHVDHDRTNNRLENLALWDRDEHRKYHARIRPKRDLPEAARQAAKEWHGSDAGRQWHSEHAKRIWEQHNGS